MSKAHDAGYERSGTEGSDEAQRVYSDSHKMNLIVSGFDGFSGHADEVSTRIITRSWVKEETFNWRRFFIPKLFLVPQAHLLLLQGMAPAHFFLASSLTNDESVLYKGPLIYVTGTISAPWEVPACFHNLVLGQVMKSPESENISFLEVIAAVHTHEAKNQKKN